MSETIKKQDIKDAVVEAMEPFADAVKKDFTDVDKRFDKVDERFESVDERFNKIEMTLINIVEELKEAREERAELKASINQTYNAVDGFVKVVTKLEQEFTLMKEDLNRVKTVIREKLGVDLT